MKKVASLVLFLLMVLVPVHNALGLSISVTSASKMVSGSSPTICFPAASGRLCLPLRIPSGNSSIIPINTSRLVVVKVNGQPITVSRTASSSPAITTPSAPTPAATPPASNNSSLMQQEMLGYINAERVKVNAPALILDQKLSDGAYLKSQDMALNGYFDHNSPSYGSPFDMMKSLGITYRTAGENIAKHTSVKGAHDAFMNSPGHKANILNTNFKKVGLGFYSYNHYLYVTQWFKN